MLLELYIGPDDVSAQSGMSTETTGASQLGLAKLFVI